MPDFSFLKPSSDVQFISLMVVLVLLVPKLIPILSKKLKFKESESSGCDSVELTGECKKEGVLEGILKQLSDLGRDVDGLASELKTQSVLNDERHNSLKEQIGSVNNRVNDIYSILLNWHGNGGNSASGRNSG